MNVMPPTSLPTNGDSSQTPREASALAEPLLKVADAAALLNVKPSWIYEPVRTLNLPHVKLGRHLRFLRSDLEAFVLEQRRRARVRG